MIFRTDLAVEAKEASKENIQGVEHTRKESGDLKIEKLTVKNEKAALCIGKQMGTYITFDIPPLTDNFKDTDERIIAIGKEIRTLLPELGLVMVVGLGNREITPDSLGPKTTEGILATRHIQGELARAAGLDNLRPVCVLSTGVTGQTGIETCEYVESLIKKVKPSVVIAIDALASRRLERLGSTIQLSDTGIHPGSGIGNNRAKLTHETLGVPVLGIGVPTVVTAETLAFDLLNIDDEAECNILGKKVAPNGRQMVVTPKEVDLLISRTSKLLSMAINYALHKEISLEDIINYVS